jgi:hypothetical protein
MKNIKSFDRRKFLAMMAPGVVLPLASTPLGIIMDGILNKVFANVHGAEIEWNNQYLLLYMNGVGGPPRWMFDYPLAPRGIQGIDDGGQDAFVDNPFSITKFTNVEKTYGRNDHAGESFTEASRQRTTLHAGEYQSEKKGDFFVPPIWDGQMPFHSAGNVNAVSMESLLKHCLFFTGYTLGQDGHDACRLKHFFPGGVNSSFSGVVADRASKTGLSLLRPIPFSDFAFGRDYYFSDGGTAYASGPKDLHTANPINHVLSSFKVAANSKVAGLPDANKKQLIALFNQTFERMKQDIEPRYTKRRSIHNFFKSAQKAYEKNIDAVIDSWDSTLPKYKEVISEAIINDTYAQDGIDRGDFLTVQEKYDLKNYNWHEPVSLGTNLNDLLPNEGVVGNLAESLAIAEIIFNNKISSSIHLACSSLKFNLPGFNNDIHSSGSIITLFAFTKYYRAISAGIHQLTQELNDFNDTLIHLASDFNRNGRTNGKGTDHGWDGSNSTLISGKIKENLIVGKSCPDNSPEYYGSWGKGAKGNNKKQLDVGNLFSTMSTIMDVDNPNPLFSSTVKKSGDEITVLDEYQAMAIDDEESNE